MELEKISLCQYRANCNIFNRNSNEQLKLEVTKSIRDLKKLKRSATEKRMNKLPRQVSAENLVKVVNVDFQPNKSQFSVTSKII